MKTINSSWVIFFTLLVSSCGDTSTQTNDDNAKGGATSATCTRLDSDIELDRVAAICGAFKLAFDKDKNLTITSDYKHTSAQGYPEGKTHTGIDVQAEGSDVEVSSITAGTIIGFDTTFGSVVIDTRIGNGAKSEVQIAYLHLEEINNELYLGKTIDVGTLLGKQGRTGLPLTAGKHLHIEIRDLRMARNSSLDITSPDDTGQNGTWKYSLDPYQYFTDIVASNTNSFTGTVIQASFPLVVEYPDPSYITGFAYNRSGLDNYVEFTVINNSDSIKSTETYQPSPTNLNRIIDFGEYHFGSEDIFSESGAYKLRVLVKAKGDVLNEESKLFVFDAVSKGSSETVFNVDLVGDYFYVQDSPYFDGCITDPDGIFSLKFKLTYPDGTIFWQESDISNSPNCSGDIGSIDISNGRSKIQDENGSLILGNYSITIEVMDEKGIISQSRNFDFEVKNQVDRLETPNTLYANYLNEYVIHRISNDVSYHQIVNLPACLYMEISGEKFGLNKREQNTHDFGIYRVSDKSSVVTGSGLQSYEVFVQCSSQQRKVVVLSGNLNFNN